MTLTAAEAKDRLDEVLAAAQAGERILLTRAGVPVAEVGPVQPATDINALFREMDEFSKRHRLAGVTIRELREEGRPCGGRGDGPKDVRDAVGLMGYAGGGEMSILSRYC